MNKTVYLPAEEVATWEKARKLANDRLSPVILKALREFIMTKEAEAAEVAGFERIDLQFEDSDDNHLPKRKAFRGKWIYSPQEPFVRWSDRDHTKGGSYAIAISPKGKVVVYSWEHEQQFDPDAGEFVAEFNYRFLVFPSFEEAALDSGLNYAIREAIKKRGVPVEKLDI